MPRSYDFDCGDGNISLHPLQFPFLLCFALITTGHHWITGMADFSSLTHKFRANLDNQSPGVNKVSKRNRQPLSCAPCRSKKLKCDRGHPCETCIKREDPAGCTYGKTAAPLSKAESNHAHNGADNRGKAQERLRHLEDLVMQMVDNTSPPSNLVASPDKDSLSSDQDPINVSIAKEGHLQHGSSASSYVGSTHWSAILENIQELKTALGTEHPSSTELDEPEDTETSDMEELFGSTGDLSLAQVLAQALPSRLQTDRRMSTYFNSRYAVIPFIHTTQFQRQYEQFWQTPLETAPLWVSMFFSICCMSATLSEAVGSEPSTPEDQPSQRTKFLTAACQCLRLGDFIRPKRWVVEALALYSQCKYMSTLDPSREIGALGFSLVIRQAFRSGYHRDASQFPHFSVFEAEMRRRAWAMLRQFDLMLSFQLGLPSHVPPDSWDTLLPRNLLDADFDEDTTILPPSRPESEPTQLLYFIVKSRLMTWFGKVCAHALSFRDSTQKEVMDLDAEVRAVHKTVPETLRIKPMSQSFADPSYLVMVRLNCEFLYQKSLCVLHRKYLTHGGYPASTAACTDAAIAIIKHMLDLHKEFKPGGQLHADRWMLTSFTMNDFYLASVVLCLALSTWKRTNAGRDISEDEQKGSQYDLLMLAFALCEELGPTSSEARRVANVLSVVLNQIGSGKTTSGSTSRKSASASVTGSSAGTQPRLQHPLNPETGPAPLSSQPGPFWRSGLIPTPNDFNLAPLSLNDRDMQTQGASPPVGVFHPETPVQHPNPNPTQTTGQQSPDRKYSNPFLPFPPAWPPYASRRGTSASSVPNTNTNTTSPSDPSSGPGPQLSPDMSLNMNVDIDWAVLDQWMSLPNSDIMSLPETFLPFNMSPPPYASESQSQSHQDMPNLPAVSGQDWTSSPLAFLGGQREEETQGTGQGEGGVAGQARTDTNRNIDDNRKHDILRFGNTHYPGY